MPTTSATSKSVFSNHAAIRSLLFAVVLFAVALCGLAGCGYAVGNGFDTQIHTVAVPVFASTSFRRGIEFQLTEAVQKEIQDRTPFRLADESTADTRLVGRLVQADKRRIINTQFDDPRQLEFNLAMEVRWEDTRNGRVLALRTIPISPDTVALTSSATFAPEIGQSRATAEQTAVTNMARQVVDLMEVPW